MATPISSNIGGPGPRVPRGSGSPQPTVSKIVDFFKGSKKGSK